MRYSAWKKPLILLFFIGFLNLFLFHSFGQTALALIFAVSYLFLVSLFFETHAPAQRLPIAGLGGYLGLLLLFMINRDQWFTVIVISITCFYTLTFILYLLSTRIPFVRSLLELLLIPVHLGISYFKAGLRILEKMISANYASKKSKFDNNLIKSIVIGLIIGLPVVFALIVLLSGADPIYAKFIEGILKLEWFKIPDSWRTRIIFSLFWLIILSPLLYFRRKSEFLSPLSTLANVTFTREMSIVMLLVALTLGSFLVIQAPYVFVNVPFETDLSKFGVATYSEYVKKGFFELLFVAAFIYSLVWLGLIFLRDKIPSLRIREGQGELRKFDSRHYLFALQLFVLTEFGIFLLSIFRRIYLYQLHHGWSLVRIYGGLFLIWLTFITIILLLRHFYTKRWVFVEVGATVALTLFFGIFNAEHFIATTHPPTVNKRIDYVYLSRMSADGFVGWEKAYTYAKNILLTERSEVHNFPYTREVRREIAYAGFIVSQLVKSYHELALQYATLEQWENINIGRLDYFKSIAEDQKKFLEYFRIIANYDRSPQNPYEVKIREIEDVISKIETKKQAYLVQAEIINDFDIVKLYRPEQYDPNAFSFCSIPKEDFLCRNSFIRFKPDSVLVSQTLITPLDKIFSWNGSESRAFNALIKKISYSELVELEKRYFRLFNDITSELPPEERGFDIDISFNTPFL